MASEFYPLFLRLPASAFSLARSCLAFHHETQLRCVRSINENPQKADHLPLPCLTLVMGACCDQVRFQFVKLPCQKGREFEVSSLKMHPLRVFSSRLQPQQHNKPPQTSCNHHSHLLQLLTVANNTSTADSNLSTFKGRTPENAKGDPTFASRFRQGPNTPRQLPMFSCHRTISQTSG